jgi:AcrR family transcriptional regulator
MSNSNRGRPRRSQSNLSKLQIVKKANEVAKSEGLSACTFRRLAGELGVTAMAVSYHVSTRRNLLLSMIDDVFAPLNAPLETHSPKSRLKELLFRYVEIGQAYGHLVHATLQDPSLMQRRLKQFTNQLRAETQLLNAGDANDVLLNLLVDYTHGHMFAVAAATDGQGPKLEVFQRSLDWILEDTEQ